MSSPRKLRDVVYTTIHMVGLEFKKHLDVELASGIVDNEEYLVSLAGMVQACEDIREEVLSSLSAEDRDKVITVIATFPEPQRE